MNGTTRMKSVLGGVLLAGGLAFASVASANVITTHGINVTVGDNGIAAKPISGNLTPLSGAFGIQEWIDQGGGQSYGYLTGGLAGSAGANYCASGAIGIGGSGCLLTFQVTGADLASATQVNGVNYFQPVQMNVWVNDGTNFNTNNPTYASADAGNSNLLLTLTLNDFQSSQPGGTLGQITFAADSVTPSINNGQTGLLNWIFSEAGPQGGLWFNGTANYAVNPSIPTTLTYTFQSGFQGQYYAVPEPGDLGMMGLGLLMVGLMGLRFRQSRFRRD
jgi:hypothetical protein